MGPPEESLNITYALAEIRTGHISILGVERYHFTMLLHLLLSPSLLLLYIQSKSMYMLGDSYSGVLKLMVAVSGMNVED